MRYSLSDLGAKFLTTTLFLIILEIISATIISSLFDYHLRFFFLGVFCIYFSLELQLGSRPYIFLIFSWIHSIFSLEGWAMNCMIALLFLAILSVIKDLIQLNTYKSKCVFYFLGLLFWDFLRVIIVSLKLNTFENFLVVLGDDLLGNVFLAILSPLVLFLLNSIWETQKAIEA